MIATDRPATAPAAPSAAAPDGHATASAARAAGTPPTDPDGTAEAAMPASDTGGNAPGASSGAVGANAPAEPTGASVSDTRAAAPDAAPDAPTTSAPSPAAGAGLASDTAMVLAAGLGKRMRPLTVSQPKPMVRVAGKPLLDHALDRLAAAGVGKAVVNVHYLPEAIIAHVKNRRQPAITISDERERLLETGGGLVKAQEHLPDPFFCLNSDNIWLDGPINAFRRLSGAWDPALMDALLLLVPHTGARNFRGKGDFHMAPDGRLTRRRSGRIAPFVFTGIQLAAKHLLRDAPEGPFSTNVLWDRAVEEGRLYGCAFAGEWFEVGTPQAIGPTELALAGG